MADSGLLVSLLRFLHVLAASLWMGGAAFTLMVLVPNVRRAPEAGGPFMRHLALHAAIPRFIAMNAGLATLAGLVLFWLRDATESYPTGTAGGMLFHLGAAAGFAAFLVGFLVQIPLAKRMKAEAQKQGPPGPAMMALQARTVAWSWGTFGLLVVALFGMVSGSSI